jgi:hypothetical protein
MTEAEALHKLRSYLLESIAQAADEIKDIDRQLAVLRSLELETILIESENQAAEAAIE